MRRWHGFEADSHPLTLKLGSGFTLGAVDGLRVSELAERAGVAPSTVRFYERAGLLSPPRRAANGYRVFDESALDELAFISRAKGIGMSLEDIAGLVASWPVGECRSLQARLRAYLAGRISQVRQQAAEMGMFERQLQAVLDRLSARDPGPEHCGRGCSCEADLDLASGQTSAGPVPLENTIRPVTCGSCGRQAACMYSLIRPLRTGFRRIRSISGSIMADGGAAHPASGTRWAMPWCGRAAL
jgi:DNA-binding transcriptional MerR regulator